MEPQKELWGVGKTFVLTCLAIVATVALMIANVLPAPGDLGAWSQLVLSLIGPYAAKSGISKITTVTGGGK